MPASTRTWLLLGLILLALLGVFSLYLHPDFMLDMANQLWLCR